MPNSFGRLEKSTKLHMVSTGSGEEGLYIQTKTDPFLVVVSCLTDLCTYKVCKHQVENDIF